MIKPRFAINTYTIGGIVFLVVAVALYVGARMVPIQQARSVLLPMAALFGSIGMVWTVLAGRRGRLRAPRGLAESGLRSTATFVAVRATRSVSRAGEYGPVLSQVFRLDLQVRGPSGPYVVRIYRSLRGTQIVRAAKGATVPVAIDPATPRKIAILWEEAASFASWFGWPVGAPTASPPVTGPPVNGRERAPRVGGHLSGPRVDGHLSGVSHVGTADSGAPALHVEVQVAHDGHPSRVVRGVVNGPAGRTPQVGEVVTVQLDPSGKAVLSIAW